MLVGLTYFQCIQSHVPIYIKILWERENVLVAFPELMGLARVIFLVKQCILPHLLTTAMIEQQYNRTIIEGKF